MITFQNELKACFFIYFSYFQNNAIWDSLSQFSYSHLRGYFPLLLFQYGASRTSPQEPGYLCVSSPTKHQIVDIPRNVFTLLTLRIHYVQLSARLPRRQGLSESDPCLYPRTGADYTVISPNDGGTELMSRCRLSI